jgi:succinate dehydrogenase / fumarate reductase flavoprotein subunit
VWVPRNPGDDRPPRLIPEAERDYFLERMYPSYGNLVPRDVASRAVKRMVDSGRGVGPLRNGVYLDFADAITRLGRAVIEDRYGNLFEMYEKITGESPWETPMRIYPAPHYTMGGLWVDYNLMSTIPGLFVAGEANFSDHGANRLGASALMQGLADGYFILPYTLADYLAGLLGTRPLPTDHPAFKQVEAEVTDRVKRLLAIKGTRSPDYFHRELGKVMWDLCGMERSAEGLQKALSEIPALREEFYRDLRVPGANEEFNQALEKAGRVEDFLEFAELIVRDALHRNESCGGHFRVEYQTEDGEALRNDDEYAYVAAWEFTGVGCEPKLHKEPLIFEFVHPSQRSYK